MKSKVLLTLASAALVLGGLAGCQVTPSDNVDSEIYNVYVMYQNNGGTLTYEEWLATIKGEKGDKGDTGSQGPKGDKGDAGAKGDKGDTGAAGSQGEKGDKGDKGDAGAAGEDGASILTGQGVPVTSLGKKGDSYIDTDTFDYYIKGDNGWTKAGNIKGAAGDKGDAGSQGEKGDKGDAGAQGEKGDKGDKGDTGAAGAQGEKGDKGETGETGSQGPKGDQGEKGDKGDQGEAGKDGEDGATAYSSTILPSNDGYILPSVGSAVVGADISFRICPNKDAVVETFVVNGESIDVATLERVDGTDSDLLYKTKMVEGGFVVRATYRYVKVEIGSTLTEDAKNRITSADKYTAVFTEDITLSEMAPLAKEKTTYDLNGHTLTFDGSLKNPLFITDGDQKLEITNGGIVFESASNNGILLSGESDLLLDGVTIEYNVSKAASTDAAILFNQKATATIKDSKITSKSAFCVSTNNLEGSGKIIIEGSEIIGDASTNDDVGFMVNSEGASVELRNSTFKGNRQGAIIRTGDALIENCTFEITGKWIENEANKATNSAYLSGSWSTGNEVPSAALVCGDSYDPAYDTPVNVTIGKDSSFVAPEGYKVVVRSDAKCTTTIKTDFDSRALFEANKDDKSVVTLGDNVEYVTVGELAKMTDESENKGNLFYVTGVLTGKDSLNDYGKCTIIDPETGDSLLVYGCLAKLDGTIEDNFSYANNAYTAKFKANTNPVVADNLGKLTTLVGTFTYYAKTNTPELGAAAIYSQETKNYAKGKITIADSENGSIVLKNSKGETITSDSELTYGEEITIESATPAEGYELSKIEVTVDGVTNTYKAGDKFTAGLSNKVTATFKEASSTPTEELKQYTYTFKSASDTTTSGKAGIDGKWTASAAVYVGFDTATSLRGLQIGKNKEGQTDDWTLVSPVSNFGSKIIGVAIESSVASSGNASISVKAGDHVFFQDAKFNSTSTTSCGSTADTLLSLEEAITAGDIVIAMKSTVAKAMYIKSVTVWYYWFDILNVKDKQIWL